MTTTTTTTTSTPLRCDVGDFRFGNVCARFRSQPSTTVSVRPRKNFFTTQSTCADVTPTSSASDPFNLLQLTSMDFEGRCLADNIN